MSDKILKLNQAQTLYNDLRERIEALPTDNDIPTKISDLIDDSGHYTKPAEGIPTSDLSEEIVSTINGKAPAIYCEKSGAIASFNDGAEDMPLKECVVNIEPVQDLHGYDNPWPAGSGTNIFSPTVTVSSTRIADVTVSQGNEEVTLTETSDANYCCYGVFYNLKAGTYTFRYQATASDSFDPSITIYKTGSIVVSNAIPVNTSRTFTIDEDTTIEVRMFASTSGNGVIDRVVRFYQMQLESGSTASEWTPYSNICHITGWTEAKVSRTGINVWDEQWENGTFNTTTGVNINNQSTNQQIRSKNMIPIVGGKSYYFKWVPNPSVGSGLWTMFYDNDGNIITGFVPSGSYVDKSGNCCLFKNRVVETPSNAAYCKFYCTYDYGSIYNSDISINYPASDTAYHSGQVAFYPIIFPAEAGTVYGGTLDVVKGTLTVDRAKIILDGTQMIGISNWRPYDGSSAWLYTPNITPGRVNTMGKIGAICDLLKEIPYGSNDAPSGIPYIYGGKCGISSVGSNAYGLAVRVPVSGLTNNSLINTWLNDNPITVVYPLATPITYTLTPEGIRTLLGTNNIWADTGDTAITYSADTKMFVEQNTPDVPVQDVQVNGTSILSHGVANVPALSNGTLGVAKIGYSSECGLEVNSAGMLKVSHASATNIKAGASSVQAITPDIQHTATFYGLAKAAGADMKDIANTTVGIYPDAQKEAIQSMLGITQMLAPENPNLVASQAYSIGDVFAANGHLYKATAAIAQDGAIIPDTNCVETTMVDAGGKIKDVQVAGSSVVGNDGVANIPKASTTVFGAASILSNGGIILNSEGRLFISSPSETQIRTGTGTYLPLVAPKQHLSVFYGLAKAAGDTTQSQSSNAVGAYTDEAKTAIKAMLGVQDGLKVVRLI